MKNFIQHWKRGWKFLLLELCLILAYVLIVLPVMIITQVVLNWSMFAYYISIAVVSIILVPAVTQYLFEIFYGPYGQQQKKH
ncbi:MAG: hypothetical protein K9L86_06450 [Candidatus Omnitrophica bacterium]|nr:hypothetical protein [Candidatus Omnitrophota bacterium]